MYIYYRLFTLITIVHNLPLIKRLLYSHSINKVDAANNQIHLFICLLSLSSIGVFISPLFEYILLVQKNIFSVSPLKSPYFMLILYTLSS